MTDPTDGRDKHHRRRHHRGQDRRVVESARGHALPLRRAMGGGGGGDLIGETGVHRYRANRRARRGHVDGDPATGVHLVGEFLDDGLETVQHRLVGVAKLQLQFGEPGHDGGGVGCQPRPPHGPHTARAGGGRERGVDPVGHFIKPGGGVPAVGHHRSAGVVLLAVEAQQKPAQSDNRFDHPNFQAGFVKVRPLFDMGLQKADMATRLDLLAGDIGEPGVGARGGQVDAIAISDLGQRRVVDLADEGPTPETPVKTRFLVLPRDHIDSQMSGRRVFRQGPRHLQAIDHTEGAIQPSAGRLTVRMGTDQHRRAGLGRAAENIANTVNASAQAGGGEAFGQPMAGGHIGVAEGWAHHAGRMTAEFAQGLQVVNQTPAIDGCHAWILRVRSMAMLAGPTIAGKGPNCHWRRRLDGDLPEGYSARSFTRR